jgi:outer membrane autotransporter protein
MKQKHFVILTALMLSISIISNAQIKQGEKMLGGNISFLNSTDETEDADNKYTNSRFNITPQLGFGLANNWIVGIQAGYSSTKETEEDEPEDWEEKTSGFSVGAFARKFKPFNDYCGIFGQASFDYGFGKFESTEFEGEDKFSSISAQLRPGLYFLPTKKLIVEATFGQLGYTTTKTTNDDDDYENKNNEFAVSFLDGLSFGVKFIF